MNCRYVSPVLCGMIGESMQTPPAYSAKKVEGRRAYESARAGVAVGVAALFMEAASGPTFRAEDHPDLQACMRAIPAEWGPGSLQRDGAEQACMYVHGRGR